MHELLKQTDHQANKPSSKNGSFFGGGGRASFFQAKSRVNETSDPLEKSADEAAERAVGPEPMKKSGVLGSPNLPPSDPISAKEASTIGLGRALDPDLRAFMEVRMGADFSSVRIQTDGAAAKSAEDMGARAYAFGEQIVFSPGAFQPETAAGRRLLAHELAHVLQQRAMSGGPMVQKDDATAKDAEQEVPSLDKEEGLSYNFMYKNGMWVLRTEWYWNDSEAVQSGSWTTNPKKNLLILNEMKEKGAIAAYPQDRLEAFAKTMEVEVNKNTTKKFTSLIPRIDFYTGLGLLTGERIRVILTSDGGLVILFKKTEGESDAAVEGIIRREFERGVPGLPLTENGKGDIRHIADNLLYNDDIEPPFAINREWCEELFGVEAWAKYQKGKKLGFSTGRKKHRKAKWASGLEKDVKAVLKSQKTEDAEDKSLPDSISIEYDEESKKYKATARKGKKSVETTVKSGQEPDALLEELARKLRFKELDRFAERGESQNKLGAENFWAYEFLLLVRKRIYEEKKRYGGGDRVRQDFEDLPDKVSLGIDERVKNQFKLLVQVRVEKHAVAEDPESKFEAKPDSERVKMKSEFEDKAVAIRLPLFKSMLDTDSKRAFLVEAVLPEIRAISRELRGKLLLTDKKDDAVDLSKYRTLSPYPAWIEAADTRPDFIGVTGGAGKYDMVMNHVPFEGSSDNLTGISVYFGRTVYYDWIILPAAAALGAADYEPLKKYDWPMRRKAMQHLLQNKRLAPFEDHSGKSLLERFAGLLTGSVDAIMQLNRGMLQVSESDSNVELELPNAAGEYVIFCQAFFKPEDGLYRLPSMAFFPVWLRKGVDMAAEGAHAEANLLEFLRKKLQAEEAKSDEDRSEVEIEKLKVQIKALETNQSSTLYTRLSRTEIDLKRKIRWAKKLPSLLDDFEKKQSADSNKSVATKAAFVDVLLQEGGPKLIDFWLNELHGDRYAISTFLAHAEIEVKEVGKIADRLGKYDHPDDGLGQHYPVNVSFASEVTGHQYNLLMTVADAPTGFEDITGQTRMALIDVTVSHDIFYGFSSNADKDKARKEAIKDAFDNFASGKQKYGEGYLSYHLPSLKLSGDVLSEPGLWEEVTGFLEKVAMVAGIAALVLATGGVGGAVVAGMGLFAGAVGAASAIGNIRDRARNHRLGMDAELALDLLSITGFAAAVGAGRVAKLVDAAGDISRTTRGILALQRGFFIYQKADLVANIAFTSIKTLNDLADIEKAYPGDENRARREAYRGQILFNAGLSGMMFTMSVKLEALEKWPTQTAQYAQEQFLARQNPARYDELQRSSGLTDQNGDWSAAELHAQVDAAFDAITVADDATVPKSNQAEPKSDKPAPKDDDSAPKPDQSEPKSDKTAQKDNDSVPKPEQPVPKVEASGGGGGRPPSRSSGDGSSPRRKRPSRQRPDKMPEIRAERTRQFMESSDIQRVLAGDPEACLALLQTHGIWRDLVLDLPNNHGATGTSVVERLTAFRETIRADLKTRFGLDISDPKASTGANSDIDLATTGSDAGQRMNAGMDHMNETYGPNWPDLLRMNFYTEAERHFTYESARGKISHEEFSAMQSRISELTETLVMAREIVHAEGDAGRLAIVERQMSHLSDAQKADAHRRAVEMEVAPADQLHDLNLEIDALVTQKKALPADSPLHPELAERITIRQMEANALTFEANIGPGANQQAVRGLAVAGHEAYQAVLGSLDMMFHNIFEHHGDVRSALQEYEIYKYVHRLITATITAGVTPDALMLHYYEVSQSLYRGDRGQLLGINRYDQSYAEALHDQFLDSVRRLLPVIKARAQAAGDTGPAPRLDLPRYGGMTYIDISPSSTGRDDPMHAQLERLRIIGQTPHGQKPPAPAPEVPIRPIERGQAGETRPDKSTLPIVTTGAATESARIIDHSDTERYYVTDSSNPRFMAFATVQDGKLSIDLRTVFEDGSRSTVLIGGEQVKRILEHFNGRFEAIAANWQYGSNLKKFNDLTANGASPEQAAHDTWTGHQAANHGYGRIEITEIHGQSGEYTHVKVLFWRGVRPPAPP